MHLGLLHLTEPQAADAQASKAAAQLGISVGKPPACVCKCGGETKCESGQWAFCECQNGKCHGVCTKEKSDPLALAADVTSVIELRPVTVDVLRERHDTYASLLQELLSGKVKGGQYVLSHGNRSIGFSFTDRAVDLLTQASRQLRAPGPPAWRPPGLVPL